VSVKLSIDTLFMLGYVASVTLGVAVGLVAVWTR
jgi:hypothetical protein